MALFPTFIDLNKKNILLLGGGTISLRKFEKLYMFRPENLKIVAKEYDPEFLNFCQETGQEFETREFEWSDLDNIDMVLVAIDNIDLQKKIFDYCEDNNLLCNSVDSINYCNFIFPALVTRGDLCLGINTNGKAPYLSRKLRQKLDRELPKELGEIVEKSGEFRSSLPKKITEQVTSFVDGLLAKINF